MSVMWDGHCGRETCTTNLIAPKLQRKSVGKGGSGNLSFSIDAILGIGSEASSKVAADNSTPFKHQYDNSLQTLNRTGPRTVYDRQRADLATLPAFDWMQCTRYRPPKVTSEYLFFS